MLEDFLGSNGDALSRRTEAMRVLVGSIVFAALYTYPLLLWLGKPTLQNDWDFTSELDWVAYHTVVHFHQFPLWNPYKCGGMGMLANPQSRFLSPFFLLHLLFGPSIGLHLEVTFHLAVMWAGCYVLARVLGLRPLAAVTGALVFCAAPWFAIRLGEGQIVMLPFAYISWILAMLTLAADHRAWTPVVIAAALIALAAFEGGIVVLVYCALPIGLFALTEAVRCRSLWPLAYLAVAVALSAGIAAIKMVPAYELVSAHPRQPWGPMAIQWRQYPQLFIWRDQRQMCEANRFYLEFSNYISPVFIALALAVTISGRWRALSWLAIVFVLAFAMRGDDGEIPIWRWIHLMPMGTMLRLSSRMAIPFTLCVGVLAAFGVEGLVSRFGEFGLAIVMPLIIIGAADSLQVGTPYQWHAFDRPEGVYPMQPSFRQVSTPLVFDQTAVAKHNMGMAACYEYVPWTTSVASYNRRGYKGEQYLIGAGTVTMADWTPNRLSYDVEAPAAATMVINQSYDRGWEIHTGAGELVDQGGLLAVKIPPSHQRITLVYSGRAWKIGAAITLFSIIAGLLLLRRDKMHRHVLLARPAS